GETAGGGECEEGGARGGPRRARREPARRDEGDEEETVVADSTGVGVVDEGEQRSDRGDVRDHRTCAPHENERRRREQSPTGPDLPVVAPVVGRPRDRVDE